MNADLDPFHVWKFHGRALVATVLAFALCILSPVQPAAQMNQPGMSQPGIAGYKLGAGDQIRLTVHGEPDLSGEFSVDGTGRISLPLIGMVNAKGQTAPELEKAIVDRYKPDYLKNPSVSVEVMTYRPFYIVGEVNNPGGYPYVSGMTVINAVALAGGFTYRAREEDFYIKRTVDGEAAKMDAQPETQVLPGDVITVRERFF